MPSITALVLLFFFINCCLISGYQWKHPSNSYKLICYYSGSDAILQGGGKLPIQDIDPNLCTHLIYNHAVIGKTYRIHAKYFHSEQFEWRDEDYWQTWKMQPGKYKKFAALKNSNPHLKTLISLHALNNDAEIFSQVVNNMYNQKIFIESVVEFLEWQKFDGLNLNWVSEYCCCQANELQFN